MNKVVLHTHSDWYSGQTMFQSPRQETWEWFKHPPKEAGEVHIFEDLFLTSHVNYKGVIKIASIVEAPVIYDNATKHNSSVFHPYRWIENNHQQFDYVMSPFRFLEKMFPNRFFWIPAASSRIMRDQIGLYEKSRNLSIVASFKTWTPGHQLRHEFIKRYGSVIDFDIYGSGYNTIIDDTTDGRLISLAPYRYNICIMNSIEDGFFSEHVTDVFAVGTIPVIWAANDLNKYFNPDGFIQFNDLNELDTILPTLTEELYLSKLEAVKDNIERSKKYMNSPDYIYETYKNELETLQRRA